MNASSSDDDKPRRPLPPKALALIRRLKTTASDRYRIGGKLKERNAPRAIALPILACLRQRDDGEP
jgi:hypothetical protein